MRGDIAADIANTVFYANANAASWDFIRPEINNNPSIFPDEETWKRLYPIKSADPSQRTGRATRSDC